jgi:Ca2+-binding RTX toxin-like protein
LADRLLGGTGDDTIHLAEGDTVTGGAGADTFIFTIGAGPTDSDITDFEAGDAIVVVYNGQFNGLAGNPNPIPLVTGTNPIADLPG